MVQVQGNGRKKGVEGKAHSQWPFWCLFSFEIIQDNINLHTIWMAYKEPFTIENSLMKLFVLVFYILNSVPCVGTSAMKRHFFLHNLWSIFLDQDNLVWTHLFPWWNFKPPWTCSGEWTRAKKAKGCFFSESKMHFSNCPKNVPKKLSWTRNFAIYG